jgi:fucose permease
MMNRSTGSAISLGAQVVASGLVAGAAGVALVPALLQGVSGFLGLALMLGAGVGTISAAAGYIISALVPTNRATRTVVLVVLTGLTAWLLGGSWKLAHPVLVAVFVALVCGLVYLLRTRRATSAARSR